MKIRNLQAMISAIPKLFLKILAFPQACQNLTEGNVWLKCAAMPLMYSLSLGMLGRRIVCDAAPQVRLSFSRGNCGSQKITTEQFFKFSTQSKHFPLQDKNHEISSL